MPKRRPPSPPAPRPPRAPAAGAAQGRRRRCRHRRQKSIAPAATAQALRPRRPPPRPAAAGTAASGRGEKAAATSATTTRGRHRHLSPDDESRDRGGRGRRAARRRRRPARRRFEPDPEIELEPGATTSPPGSDAAASRVDEPTDSRFRARPRARQDFEEEKSPPRPSWADILQDCLFLARGQGRACSSTPRARSAPSAANWPSPGVEAIAVRLVPAMDKALKAAPTRSVSVPLGSPAPHRVAGPAVASGLVTVGFVAEAPLKPEVRPTIDAELKRGASGLKPAPSMARLDPHSYVDRHQRRRVTSGWSSPSTSSADASRGSATLVLSEGPASGPLDLDTKGLDDSRRVRPRAGAPVPFALGPEEPVLGRRLRLDAARGRLARCRIRYETSPRRAGPAVARARADRGRPPSLPVQPVPADPRAHGGAAARTARACASATKRRIDGAGGADRGACRPGPPATRAGPTPGTRTFLLRRCLSPFPPTCWPSRWAASRAATSPAARGSGPSRRRVDAAAHEFAEIEAMIARGRGACSAPTSGTASTCWSSRPSFPYGGMENPRMTFLTPTLLAGDRSLVDVVVHELAHSWTGNLVTNATIDHFWLNEGFTVWAERRILEALHGPDAAAPRLGPRGGRAPRVARALRCRLALHPPAHRPRRASTPTTPSRASPTRRARASWPCSSARSGASAGTASCASTSPASASPRSPPRSSWPSWKRSCPGSAATVDARRWLYEPGLPENAPVFRSAALEALTALAEGWPEGCGRRPPRRRAGTRTSCSSTSSTCPASWTPLLSLAGRAR